MLQPSDRRDTAGGAAVGVLDSLPDAVLAVDAAWRVTVANARARALLDRPRAVIIGEALWELLPGGHASDVGRCCRQAAAEGRPYAIETMLPGVRGWWRVHAAPAPGGLLVLYARDVTAERRLVARATHLAECDALTGAASRRQFTERLTRVVAHARSAREDGSRCAAVLLFDLDGFAAVNAARGHDAGDRLLCLVAERLLGAARGEDLVARVGADEFAVLLAEVVPDEVTAVGARLLAALAAPFALGVAGEGPDTPEPPELRVTASLGMVAVDGAAKADELLGHASIALQRAKAAGRGQLAQFTPALQAEARARHALAAALRGALDDGEFSLAYQPIVDLHTGAPTSVEALLRWRHPTLGAISPATFIPLAEELGLIGPIGQWVLRAACHAIAGCASGDGPLAVGVNVSGHQLQASGFADEVAAVLVGAGLPPGRLTLEVTETALVRDPRRARRVLGELRALGVRIAIDDFGTGYSSLGYLQQLPLDVLKIDKRFVDGVARGNGPSVAIPRAVIALGEALGLRTVAEGVETAAQRDTLRTLGCGYGQGYLFARPLALPDLTAWLDAAAWAESTGVER